MKNPYTQEEQDIMDALSLAFNKFSKLDITHNCHSKDFAEGINKCQDVIIHRVVQRDYPETFPTQKKG